MSDDHVGDPTRRAVMTAAAGAVLAATTVGKATAKTSELNEMGGVALAAAIRARKVSARELMSACLARIDAINPAVNAVVSMPSHEALMAEAAAADERQASGATLGPLHGLPHAAKDLQPVRGLRFTQGSPIYRDRIAAVDSLMVSRLRQAGVIFVGKTNTPEFGFGSHTFNPVFGATRNAYNHARSAGGSSGGAAVALATRMLPLADGSDYGGSLRNPGGWNNVYGFRTGFGVVPSTGTEVWLAGMGVQGPMARSVEDLALLLSVQAGYDPRSPLSLPGSGAVYRQGLDAPVKGRRIGWLGDFAGDVPHEPEVLEVCRAALKSFENLGCVIEEAKVEANVEPAWQAMVKLRAWQQGGSILGNYRNPAERAQLKPEAIWEVEAGLSLSAFDITAASEARTVWSMAIKKLFDRFDYLVLPSSQVFPFPVEERWPRIVAGVAMQTYHEWMKSALLVTLAGNPALVVPAGFGAAGLPIGLQIVAPNRGEMSCLQLAKAYEAATGWTEKRPPSA
ncbi:MAG: amidase [Sphingomonas bacterium]|jgi:amidase|nr:amidase [Sphingomonas bacterium]